MLDARPEDESHGEIALITGASRGLGRALAIALERRGVTVAGIALDDLAPALPGILPVTADVTDPVSVAKALDQVRTELGAPTILINTVEVYPQRDILDETPESFMDTVRVNLGGAFNCCHAVLPDMIAAARGRIINVVTFADIWPLPMAASYSVSKGALRILTRSLVADLGDRFPGIVINDWVPGALTTHVGVTEGIEPAVAAEWGATLALRREASINGMIFDRNLEHRPPRSLKRKLVDRVLGRSGGLVKLD